MNFLRSKVDELFPYRFNSQHQSSQNVKKEAEPNYPLFSQSPTQSCIFPKKQCFNKETTINTQNLDNRRKSLQFNGNIQTNDLHENFTEKKQLIQQFLQQELSEQNQLNSIISTQISEQEQSITQRLQKRFHQLRSQSQSFSDIQHLQEADNQNESEDSDDNEDNIVDDYFIKEKNDKICRIVQHFNKQINLIRNSQTSDTEENIVLMQTYEKQKWDQIQKAEDDYNQLVKIKQGGRKL